MSVEYTLNGDVALITLNRPDRYNAVDHAMAGGLIDALERAGVVSRAAVLTGAGKAFCSGADLAILKDDYESGSPDLAALLDDVFHPTIRSLIDCKVPIVAAVNGVAAGGGCNLALGCDVVFAGESARFAQVFVNRGLAVDYGGTWLLPRLIGLQKAKDLAFRGDAIDSHEALSLGLALEVVADDQLMKRAGEYARVLAAKPPIALSMIKSGMNRLMDAGFEEGLEFEADAQAVCLGSADFRTAMIAWMKKSEGEYVGE